MFRRFRRRSSGGESNGQLSLLTSAIDTLRSLLDDNGLLDPFSRHHARHALWSLFERTGDLAALDESAALLKSAAEAAGVPGGSARSPARCA
jgi:hypothetical protein